MKVKILGLRSGNVALVDLSGAQLEVLDTILGKLKFVNEVYVNGKEYFMEQAEPHGIKLELSHGIEFITEGEYRDAQEKEHTEAVRIRMKSIFGLTGEAQEKEVKHLQDELYYVHSMIGYNDRAKYFWERGSLEHDCIDFMADDLPTIRVNKDGSIEKFPV